MGISIVGYLVENATTTLLCTSLILVLWYYWKPSPWKLPPGPRPWPLVGNSSLIKPIPSDNSGAKRIWQLAKQYNSDFVSFRVGSRQIVVLHKYDDIKEAYNMQEFSSRPEVIRLVFPGILGIGGSQWKEQRRFALHTFRDFGLGKNRMENVIQTELDYLTEELVKHNGDSHDPAVLSNTVAANIICCLIFGHRFQYEDEHFQKIMSMVTRIFTIAKNALIGLSIPLARFIPGDPFYIEQTKKLYKQLNQDVFMPEYQRHLEKFSENNIEDYMDAFIDQMKKHEGENGQHWFTAEQLLDNTGDLFQAGTETTATTLRWCLLYMANYPAVQRRVKQEICNNIGTDKAPAMEDKLKLVYTEATILEIQRMSGVILPLIMLHQSEDRPTHYKGYILPPKTTMAANLHAVHNDPHYWGDPENFRPERFIGDDGKIKKYNHFSVFSVGKRICLGESLAKMELFIFFTGILQRFTISPPDGADQVAMEIKAGHATQGPKSFKLRFIRDP